ncbi:hypothetical protein [Mesomycoplasma ovipneumoniae]|uniref:hypothetical protein n=1 Tax=Mesomycoplasma ovipneumoniae TaxID=29562 RepID=UPI00311CBBF3
MKLTIVDKNKYIKIAEFKDFKSPNFTFYRRIWPNLQKREQQKDKQKSKTGTLNI